MQVNPSYLKYNMFVTKLSDIKKAELAFLRIHHYRASDFKSRILSLCITLI